MKRDDAIPSIVLSVHALTRIAAQEAKDDSPAAQWRVLSILEREPALRVGALAAAARTTQPGMTRLLGDLERAGLVTRSADPADSRATVVSTTTSGRESLQRWREQFRAVLSPRFHDLTDEDWQALTRAADILAAHSIEEPLTRTGDDA